MKVTLEVWKEGKLLAVIDLSQPGSYLAGRHEGSSIVTEHKSCSRRHAEIFTHRPSYSDKGVTIMDLGSAQVCDPLCAALRCTPLGHRAQHATHRALVSTAG